MWTAKILIRLGRCPGWSATSQGAHAILLVLSWGGSIQFVLLALNKWVKLWSGDFIATYGRIHLTLQMARLFTQVKWNIYCCLLKMSLNVYPSNAFSFMLNAFSFMCSMAPGWTVRLILWQLCVMQSPHLKTRVQFANCCLCHMDCLPKIIRNIYCYLTRNLCSDIFLSKFFLSCYVLVCGKIVHLICIKCLLDVNVLFVKASQCGYILPCELSHI